MKIQPALLLLLALVAQGCFLFPEPEFPFEPYIEFSSLKSVSVGNSFDEFEVAISFQDGDGDLGISGQDSLVCVGRNGVAVYHNSFITFFKKRDGVFDTLMWNPNDDEEVAPYQELGRFPILLDGEAKAAIEGEIRLDIFLFHGQEPLSDSLSKGDTLRLDIQIIDNACQYSNVVSSTEFVVGEEE